MAIPATTVFEIWSTGSATNGGGFSRTGTMDATGSTSTGTSASVTFASSNYSFVSGDIGAWLYIKSGTNTFPGWYKITSISGVSAVVNATVGAAVLDSNTSANPPTNITPSVTQGIGSAATLSLVTWAIDYSQQATAQVAVTDVVTTSTTTITSATAAFTVAMVGNAVYLTGGTGSVTTQWRTIASFTNATTVVLDTTLGQTGTGATMNLGGALTAVPAINTGNASIGSNTLFIKATATYTVATALTMLTGSAGSPTTLTGYTSVRGDGGQATLQSSAIATVLSMAQFNTVRNLIIDCNSVAVSIGISTTLASIIIDNCIVKNYTSIGYNLQGLNDTIIRRSIATAGSSAAAGFNMKGSCVVDGCICYSNTGFTSGAFITSAANGVTVFNRCRAYANTGSGADAFLSTSGAGPTLILNCIAYNNAGSGVHINFGTNNTYFMIENCIFALNGAYGINSSTTTIIDTMMFNNAFYNNTTAKYNKVQAGIGDVVLTGDPFVNGSGGNFALNNTAGAGLACQATGFPGTDVLGLTSSYLDIGYAQHQCSASGNTYTRSRVVAGN